jgi:hypothetical protein
MWTHRDSVYLTATSFGGVWKTSLHGDGPWRLAVTAEHLRSPERVVPPGMPRAPWTFEPTPFVNGVRRAFAVAVARGALRPVPLDPRETHIAVDDRWDRITVAYVSVTLPRTQFDPPRLIAPPAPLDGGRLAWLWARSETAPAADPEPPPAGAIVEPRLPETHGVTVPGLLVRGLNMG